MIRTCLRSVLRNAQTTNNEIRVNCTVGTKADRQTEPKLGWKRKEYLNLNCFTKNWLLLQLANRTLKLFIKKGDIKQYCRKYDAESFQPIVLNKSFQKIYSQFFLLSAHKTHSFLFHLICKFKKGYKTYPLHIYWKSFSIGVNVLRIKMSFVRSELITI